MNKTLLTNELLPIYQTTDTGEKVVDARELCGYLNVGRDFTNWIKGRIEKFGFVEGEDFIITLAKTGERQNVTRHDYILKLDMAKELAMVENNEQGRKARRYFIEVEKRYKEGAAPKVPLANMEHDRVTKLLQMLRLAERENLFTPETDRALRIQIAESILGHSISKTVIYGSGEPTFSLTAPKSFVPDAAPSWEDQWYLTKEIAEEAGVSIQMVAAMATKHGLRSDDYSRVVKSDPRKHAGLVQILYNQEAKDKLIQVLKDRKSRSKS